MTEDEYRSKWVEAEYKTMGWVANPSIIETEEWEKKAGVEVEE